ncbi:hypothetical protein WJ972_07295 [Achromobacter insuavis]
MAFKDNRPLHLTALLRGDGGDIELAQDFWSEELFSYKSLVRYHLLKLVWVNFVGSFFQITLPLLIIAIPMTLYDNGGSDWAWALVYVGGFSVLSWLFLVIVAIATWVELKRKAKKELESG